MKISQQQLTELIRLITRGVVKEYGSMTASSQDDSTDPGSSNDGDKPNDAMTAYEKSQAERAARKKQQDTLRTAKMDLDSTKKQTDYFKAQDKQNKLDIQAKTKAVQQLSGAPASMIPAGGTVVKT